VYPSLDGREQIGGIDIMAGPLQGVRVVEVANWTFVPAAGAVLADLGADVIKVEPPNGDPQRALLNMLNLGGGGPPATGGTVGSVVNHVGFIVKNVPESVAKWKAAGVPVLPGNNGRTDQAYVVTPDGLRIEILENKDQKEPIRHEHVHFFVPADQIPAMQAWYAKTFGAKPSTTRTNAPVDDIPGAQLRFNKADAAQAPTKGRVLDHIGFDVVDLQAFVKKLEAEGIKLDRPYSKNPNGVGLAFITDPWGTYIEINERPKPVYLP